MSDIRPVGYGTADQWYYEDLPQGGCALYSKRESGFRVVTDHSGHPIVWPSFFALKEWCRNQDRKWKEWVEKSERRRKDRAKEMRSIYDRHEEPSRVTSFLESVPLSKVLLSLALAAVTYLTLKAGGIIP